MERLGPRTENYFRDLLLIFFARQRLILATTLAVFVGSVVIAFVSTPLYSATASILLRSNEFQRSPDSVQEMELRAFRVDEQDLRSEREIVLSPRVIGGAIERLVDAGKSYADELSVDGLRAALRIDVVPDTKVLDIELRRASPSQAVEILDAIIDEYMVERSLILNPERSSDFFANQVERFRSELGDAKAELVEMAAANSTANPGQEIASNLVVKQRLQETLNALEIEAIQYREEIAHLDSVLADDQIRLYSFIGRNDTVSALVQRLVDLSIERGELARNYEDESRIVASVDKQLLETAAQVRREATDHRDSIATKLSIVEQQQKALREQITKIDSRNVDLQIYEIETDSLNRELELIGQSFATFFRRNQESQIPVTLDGAVSQFYVTVLSPAHSSGEQVFPNRPLVIGLGLVAGFLAGFTLGFIREFVDHSFKVPRDVEQYSGLPFLFSVPVVVRTAHCDDRMELDNASRFDAVERQAVQDGLGLASQT
jgi:uncharacterized protein involved in exopolysaccharide biosynthesis